MQNNMTVNVIKTLGLKSVLVSSISLAMVATGFAATPLPVTKVVAFPQINTTTTKKTVKPKTAAVSTEDYSSGMAVAGANSEVTGSITTISDLNAAGKLSTVNLNEYAQAVNNAVWKPDLNVNSAMTVKLQALLDWNHTSPGAMDGGWGNSSKKAIRNFQIMHNLPADGHMNQQTWTQLTKNIPANQPVLVSYTITAKDVAGPYATLPTSVDAKSKVKGLYYQNIQEMLAERFHMDGRYLEKLNPNKTYKIGEKIMVFNPGQPLNQKITSLVANKADSTLYAYHGNSLIASYPALIGSNEVPSPTGAYIIKNQVKNPWYRATALDGKTPKDYMLPPGPNNPVGVVWMGLSKPAYGIQGTPVPEGLNHQAAHGTIRLTNWDVLEVYSNVDTGTTVEFK